MSQKVGPFGGNKGHAFDDGVFGYDDVKKVILGEDDHGVIYMKIEYVKDGKFETQVHGKTTETRKVFELNYPDEYITSIQGSYSDVSKYNSTVVKTLIFKTSHVWSGDAIDAIGAHFFASSPPLKQLEPQGGNGGSAWDDGVYDGVKKILVGQDGNRLSYVKFEYVKGSTSIPHSHGKRKQEPKEFVLDYPNEHIVSVEGTSDGFVTSITFKTSKGKTSTFGNLIGTKFVFEEKDFVLVGFRGRSNDLIDALGAHFGPAPPIVPVPVPAKKLEAKGGNGGAAWDDGFYEDVRKIYIGQGDSGVSFVKFEYVNGKELVAGVGHGKMSILGTEEFVLDFPNEYIVSVEGCYDNVYGIEAELVTMLRFKTNKRTSPPFGLDAGTPFTLEMKDHKIVGFHGKAGDFVHKAGVYVSPIFKS
ncbi:unnamed protein product [Arabidopsis arenosa]|uniref:Jacalin-type lectin domain-containing protein n=1 Tax=Arabidopsis arenosa TaxID=38785 RepID=A0A8S2A3Z3_ARAAE|nr:unnamed protein product [Arabidopsis arenosa]